ncbi:MAG: hypothetical protein APR55_03155 [Methanolinea sp. SDB]|nr:MAG: hypothetical protein APR55_03155 [Methanolinea sp. SDB]
MGKYVIKSVIALNQYIPLFFVLSVDIKIFLVSGKNDALFEKEYTFTGTSHKLMLKRAEIAKNEA